MTKVKMWSLFLVGALGYTVWAVMAYFDPSIRGSFLTMNVTMATGVIGLVLREMPTAAAPSVPVTVVATPPAAPIPDPSNPCLPPVV